MKIGAVILDRFRISEPLGSGGMGRLFRAIDLKGNPPREVAVKVLVRRFNETDTWYESKGDALLGEGTLGWMLRHIPGTPEVYGYGDHEGQKVVVMQLVEGLRLDELISAHRALKRRTAVAIACQLGEILDQVHRSGIVHRDVKDNNVMITPEGQVYLIDFGIAKEVTWEVGRQGTRGYAPYEQVRADKVTVQSDIYALGCLICLMVANRLPFLEEDDWGVGDTRPEVPAKVLHRLTPELAPLVLRMIDRDLDRRFDSITEVVAHLRKLLPPVDAPPDPQAPEPDPEAWLRAHPLRVPPAD